MAKIRKPEPKPTRRSERVQAAQVLKQSIKDQQKPINKRKRYRRPKQRKSCKLLQLLGEIRNQIYRFALVQPGETIIAKNGPGPPGLLQASRQIRKEASGIYYGENDFMIKVVDYEGAPFTNFVRAHDYATIGHDLDISILMTGPPNWKNLKAWLKEYYCWRKFRPATKPLVRGDREGDETDGDDESDDDHICSTRVMVYSLFDIVDEGPWCGGWLKLEKVLEYAHRAIAAKHHCWF